MMKRKRKTGELASSLRMLIVILSVLSQGLFLYGQQRSVSGTVIDEKGLPLENVTIRIVGGNQATYTDEQGRFTLREVDENALLSITYLGYQTLELSALSDLRKIRLISNNSLLDEVDVVAIGYGTTSRRKINSSVSTLDMEQVASIPVQSINDGIAGRIHGVIVTSSTGAPGAKSSISIRGGGSPLYVIDNMIRSQNDFENLNPNDIDSYSVLKDAAATALYGAQGGNGVVLVTTKKGKEGQVNINYAFNHILSQPTIFPKRLSSYQNLKAINDVYLAEGRQQLTPDDVLELYRTQEKPYEYPNTDWFDVALKRFAPEQRHDLSLSAGNKLLTYYASGSYYDQGTILRTDNNYNRRATYRLNTVSNFENINLKVTTGIDGFVENNSLPNSASATNYAQIFQHIQARGAHQLAYNEFGLPSANTADNPAVELSSESGYARTTSRILNGIVGFEYAAPFLQGLTLKANANYSMWNSMDKTWNASAPTYANGSQSPISGNRPNLTGVRGDGNTLLLQGYVLYEKSIGDHHFDFTGVYEQSQSKSNSLSATRQQFQIIYDQFIAGPTVNQLANGSESESARAGYVARLSYDFKNKYSVEGSFRYDGLDLFPIGKQWGTFYALSGGYVLSEENFMQSLREQNILNYLKIRGSYGLVGTADGISRFAYVSGYNVNANTWVIDGQPVQGTSEPGALPSTNFSWYSIRDRNIGLDFASLNNRLSGSIDYFYKRTTGYVVPDTRYAAPLGIGLPPINFEDAAHRRHGAEFNLGWKANWGNLTYDIGFNFTYFNELWERTTNEDEAALKNPYTRVSGNPHAALSTGFISEGFYQQNNELLTGARRVSSINTVAGDLRYLDFNGDGKIDAADQVRIGNAPFPRINYGTTINLGYKGFSLNAVVMGSGSRDRYIGGIILGSSMQNVLVYDFQRDYWTPDNRNALLPRQTTSAGVNGSNNFVTSDFWIMDSRFLRLKYLQLGYDLKASVFQRTPFKQCRVFLSGTNLLTSSKSLTYFVDPESNQSNENYPIQRTFSIGVGVGF